MPTSACNTSTLDVSQHWTYAATHTVSQTEMDGGGTLTNTASVTGPGVTVVFFFNDTATTEIYPLSLHDALPISTGAVDQTATHASQVIHYTIVVDNTGNVDLSGA